MVERMIKNGDLTDQELPVLIEKRGREVLEKFEQVIFSGIEQPKLRSILRDVNSYWKDVYRPALISFSCEAVGGNSEATGAASLMFSLGGAALGIHDDIIDKSSVKRFRRRIPGLHGPDNALIVGDLILGKVLTAIQEIVREINRPKKVIDIIETYKRFFTEICEGEFMEVSCRKDIDTELEYYHRTLFKLGADAEACTRIGGILGDGSISEVEALGEYGKRLGYVVRLGEDVKDCLNLKGNLPHRLQYESIPLPLLYAAKVSREKYMKLKSILEGPSITPKDIGRLLDLCFETKAFTYVQTIATKNINLAIQELHLLKPNNPRTALKLMIEQAFPDIAKIYR